MHELTPLELHIDPWLIDSLNDVFDSLSIAAPIFPYSDINQPSSNSNVPSHCRSSENFYEQYFPNCVEIAIYHFVNALLWDSDSHQYRFIPSLSKLKIFFTGTIFKNNLTKSELLEWHSIVEDMVDSTGLLNYFLNVNLFIK